MLRNILTSQSAKPSWLYPAMIFGSQMTLVVNHFQNLWAHAEYQFFPLILMACLVFFLRRRNTDGIHNHYGGGQIAFVAASLIVFAVAVLLHSPWLATAAAILSCGSFVLRFANPTNVRGLLAAWALLWLLLPMPMGLDDSFRQFMQTNCSIISSRILDFAGINHLMYGNVLMANGERYFVDDACSGMRSLVSMVVIVSIYVVAMRRSIIPTLGLLSLTVVACFVMNAVRITSVIILDPKIAADLSSGWAHEIFGLGIFAITLVMLFSADGLMMFATAPIHVPDVFERLEERNGFVRIWNWFFVPRQTTSQGPRNRFTQRALPTVLSTLGILFIVVSMFGELSGLETNQSVTAVKDSNAMQSALAISQNDLDFTQVGPNLTVMSFRQENRRTQDSTGEHSRVWATSIAGGQMTVSLDFPFVKFHDLTVCYKNQGWRVLSDERISVDPMTLLPTPTFHEVRMERAPGEFGYLYYGLFNSTASDGGDGLASKLISRSKLSTEPLLQAQCFIETPDNLSIDERRSQMAKYIACRGQFQKKIYGSRL